MKRDSSDDTGRPVAPDAPENENSGEEAHTFWVGSETPPQEMCASALLQGFESGKLGGDTPVRIRRDAPPRPLYRCLRELVWIDHRRLMTTRTTSGDNSRFRVAWEAAPIGMVLSDLTGRIQLVNATFACDRGRRHLPTQLREVSPRGPRARAMPHRYLYYADVSHEARSDETRLSRGSK